MRSRRARTAAAYAFAVLLTVATRGSAQAQVELGVVGGTAFAGRQDLTIEERVSPEGRVFNVVQEPKRPVDRGVALGVSFVHWTASHPRLGLAIDALYWRDSFVMMGVGTAPARETLHQERYALIASLAVRLPADPRGGPFLFGTIGAGAVDSRLIGGDQRIGFGLSAATGGEIPVVGDSILLRLEVRYLITHDFDSDDSNDQNLEFSGSPSWTTGRRVFGGHQDTRFLPILAGVFWRF